jgi:RNA 2',3'-cyclic 3'-phosphodiesterase
VNAAELPEKVRTFVAIYPTGSIVSQLEAAQARLQIGIKKKAVRWTQPEQIHLTLQFLGNIERHRIDSFRAVLERVVSESKSFQLCAETIDCFPSSKRPRIIWAGLTGELEPLQMLKQKLDVALDELGYVPEKRKFHPHLTIGRVADLKPTNARRLAKEILKFDPAQFGEWHVHEINLMQSVLSPKGAKYHLLKSFPLKSL